MQHMMCTSCQLQGAHAPGGSWLAFVPPLQVISQQMLSQQVPTWGSQATRPHICAQNM